MTNRFLWPCSPTGILDQMQATLCIVLVGLLCLTGALTQATDKIVFGVIGGLYRKMAVLTF